MISLSFFETHYRQLLCMLFSSYVRNTVNDRCMRRYYNCVVNIGAAKLSIGCFTIFFTIDYLLCIPHKLVLISSCFRLLCDFIVLAFEKVVLLKMEGLKEVLTEVKKTQSFLMLKVDQLMKANESRSVEELPWNVNFPVDSLRQLNSLEDCIGDSQFKINLVIVSKFLSIKVINRSRVVI